MSPTTAQEVVLSRAEVQALEGQRVEEAVGVYRALLWERRGSTAGLLWLDPGTHMGEHTHHGHSHHVWVIDGTPKVLGRELGPGSYAFVPPGVPHALSGGQEGCKLFYLYLGSGG